MTGRTTAWAGTSLRDRIRIISAFRHELAVDPQRMIDAIQLPFRRSAVETISAEIIPLAEACRFLECRAARLLRSKRLGWRGRPAWLFGVRSEIRRLPLGTVLIVGPANYPLMLPGIQIVQALAAGNHVVFKPAPGTAAVADALSAMLQAAGLPPHVLTVLEESPASIEPWWPRVDKVIVTGSAATGRAIMMRAAEFGLPSTMELSGCDAAIVLPGADLQRIAACLRFGLEFNGSFSCIAPRRLFVHESVAELLIPKLVEAVSEIAAVTFSAAIGCRLGETIERATHAGARLIHGKLTDSSCTPILLDHATAAMSELQQDVAAPLLAIYRMADANKMVNAVADCPYRLGATVFGPPSEAQRIAERLPVGSVVANDLIVPTADPRLPFGGAARSGFGVTRGGEGLLEMTRVQVISVRRGGMLFHLRKPTAGTEPMLRAQLLTSHSRTAKHRLRGILQIIRTARRA